VSRDALSTRQLNRATLDRQGLLKRFTGDPAAAIGRLAGLQAQHANQPYIALWSRLDALTIDDLRGALQRRTVVRATVMRGTLHLIAAADFAVYDSTMAPRRIAVWTPTAQRAGLDLGELHRALLDFCAEPRTVAEMEAHLDTVVPDAALAEFLPSGVRHAAFRAASTGGGLVHVPPSGFWGEHGRPRYIDATVWLGDPGAPVDPEVATATAVERYLGAYGPASLADIGKWMGQARVGILRAAIEGLGERVRPLVGADGRDLLDLADGTIPNADVPAPPRFLSRWDSVLIAYDDRDRILPAAHRPAVAKKNGDFLPTFLVDGFVAGLWSTASRKGAATLTLEPFATIGAADRRALEVEAERLVRFIEPEATRHEVRWV
jgi:Winged helix DNA-binding domain